VLSLLKEISYVRLIPPFCLGIVSFVFFPFHPDTRFVLLLFAFCVTGFLAGRYLALLKKSNTYGWLLGIVTHFMFYLAGYLLCAQHTEIYNEKHFSNFLRKDSMLVLQIDEPLAESAKTYKTIGKVIAITDSTSIQQVIGKVQIYLRKDSAAFALKYGDWILVKNNFAALPDAKNPREFNYKRFMGFRNIYHQAFFEKEDWLLYEEDKGNPLMAGVLQLRGSLLSILRNYVKDDQAYAVSSSLILGLREKLDDELIKAYSSSGAMHVLAVSGLHVAIMFQIFSYLFFFLDKNSRLKTFKSLIIVLIIWGYAALTGLSPSVLRAAVMFTFVALGSNMKRITNIYNMLAGSAFALLLYNPYYLMEVGFQLSYLAVIGIVMLQPKIYPLYYTRNWVLDKVWMITAVSIAAQVATFPLGLLYYYQFPVYFLVSNLFVIPVSTAILYLGVLLFGVFWIPGINQLVGFLLEKSLWLMNWVVLTIDALPYALLQGISISVPESWFIYASLLAVVAFIYWRRNSFLLAALMWVVLLLGWNVAEKIQNQYQRTLIVYSVSKNTAIDFISGSEHLFIADSALLHDYDRMLFHIKHNWWDSGLQSAAADMKHDFSLPFVKRENEYIQFFDKKMVLIDKPLRENLPKEKLRVDYVLLSKNAKVNMRDLVKMYNFRRIIFDSSNSPGKIKYWKQDCEKLGLEYYDAQENGAYIEHL